jgi:anaerobic dimethyl sulfoxide reductase subunit B (iron-sulfur subunit)
MGRYAFYFDSSGCSGCKACQVACKDRNGLEVGLLWRRVYEVSGGSWEKRGEAWQQDVFAYNLSVACNHCEKAVCMEACPTGAITQRQDGIVLIEAERCIGCRYCSWACPYEAPQYDPRSRSMTKCTFCVEDVEAGLAPACVAACPLRVLEFGEEIASQSTLAMTSGSNKELEISELVRSVAPLPEVEMTRPGMFIQPHRDAGRQDGKVANREEVRTGKKSSELPLVIFTVLVQMAVGAFIVLGPFIASTAVYFSAMAERVHFALGLLLVTGIVFILGVLTSFLHLGRPLKAYRALANWRRSWLSREILLVGLFGAGWVVFGGLYLSGPRLAGTIWVVYGLTALAGLGLIYCMAKIYQVDGLLLWKSWKTGASFYLTAGILGFLFSTTVIELGSRPEMYLVWTLSGPYSHNSITSGEMYWLLLLTSMLILIIDFSLQYRHRTGKQGSFWPARFRLALTGTAMLALVMAFILVFALFSLWIIDGLLLDTKGIELQWATLAEVWLKWLSSILFTLVFVPALGAQFIGRWLFYKQLDEREI